MARHVIRFLPGVGKIGGILRDQALQKTFKIGANARINIFEQYEACACVPNQDSGYSRFNAALGNGLTDSVGDFISADSVGRNRKLVVKRCQHRAGVPTVRTWGSAEPPVPFDSLRRQTRASPRDQQTRGY